MHTKPQALAMANHALHDSLIRVPGGSRLQRDGKSIRPFGANVAADLLGKKVDDIRNMADPFKTGHKMHAEKVHMLLLEGMDHAWLEAVARSLRMMLVPLPPVSPVANLNQEMLKLGEGFGVLCAAVHSLLDGRGELKDDIGDDVAIAIHHHAEVLAATLYELLAVLDGEQA
ncbi:MAG: phage regulatory CII family protein [Ghiorsea sp.]